MSIFSNKSFYEHQEYWDIYNKLNEVRTENVELKIQNRELKRKLDEIKPILANHQLKPAISKDCSECRYVVKSKDGFDILGCRKDAVCEDFMANDLQ